MKRMISMGVLGLVVGMGSPVLAQASSATNAGGDVREKNPRLLSTMVHSASAEAVERAIEEGSDVNERQLSRRGPGMTPLMLASAHNQDPEVVRVLIEHGAKVNARDGDGRSALMLAMGRAQDDGVVRMLVEHGAKVTSRDAEGRTVLMHACEHASDAGVISYLIEQGADLEARDAQGYTALFYAARRDRVSGIFGVLESHGVSLDARDPGGLSLLMHAATNARSGEVIDVLIRHGADINERLSEDQLEERTNAASGDTVLSFACTNPNVDVLRALLRHGADINEPVRRVESRPGNRGGTELVQTTHLYLIARYAPTPELLDAALDADAIVRMPEGSPDRHSPLSAARHNRSLANSDAFWRLNDLSYD
jgi:ankyrin repeat protein